MGKLTRLPARLQGLPSRLATFAEGDRGRAQASPWRGWYNTARWRSLRRRIFERDLFTCQWPGCGRLEGDTSLLIADHKIIHRGDARLFWDERNVWTLCKPCHDGPKQRQERAGLAS